MGNGCVPLQIRGAGRCVPRLQSSFIILAASLAKFSFTVNGFSFAVTGFYHAVCPDMVLMKGCKC